MRIGITGATGFVGRALSKTAAARGHDVIAFSRNKKANVSGAKEVRGIADGDENVPALDLSGLDGLVHLAGENVFGLWTAEKKKRIRDSRVHLTRRIAADIIRSGGVPPVFVCGSGSGAYGDRGDEVLTEASTVGAGFLAEVCREWEAAACEAEKAGTRVVMIRTGMVLGKDGGAWPLLKKVFAAFLGSPLGDGKQWVPWIHLEDEVGLILHALENDGCRGPLNLGSPNPVTNEQMTREIARQMGRPVMPKVPAFMLKLVMQDLSEVAMSSQRMTPELAIKTGYTFPFTDFAAAVESLR